jgi:hypothetical protein
MGRKGSWALALALFLACGRDKPFTQAGADGGTLPECSEGACGPTRGDFFDNDKVAELRLTIDAADLARAADEARAQGYSEPLATWLDILWLKWKPCGTTSENYLPVRMEYRSPDGVGNVALSDVGIRLRGSMARGVFPLQGFQLNVQALLGQGDGGTTSRRFAGLKKLSALSNEWDASLMIQCLAYKTMRDFGIPAPRCNHLSVYINGAYYGLMENVENVDTAAFLADHLGDADGSLYECSAGCGYDDSKADLRYLGDSMADYTLPVSPRKYRPLRGLHGDAKAAEKDLIPMLKCGDDQSTPDDQAFKACIAEWLDVDEWLRLIAGESLMPTLESFVGSLRNYFLYFLPDDSAPHGGRFQVYSWDYDTAFQSTFPGQICSPASCDPFTSVATWFWFDARAKLVTRLTNVFKTEYCQTMRDFLSKTYRPELVDDMARTIGPTVMNQASTSPFWPIRGITPGVHGRATGAADPIPSLTPDVWQGEVARIHDFIVSNRETMTTLVEAMCSEPQATPAP